MIGYSELNLHPWEFDEYTMDDFVLRVKGAREVKQEQWHHTRALAYVMAKPYFKNPHTTIDQFWSFDNNNKRTVKPTLTPREVRQKYIDAGIISDN